MKKLNKSDIIISKIKDILDKSDINYDDFMKQFNKSIKCEGFRHKCKNNRYKDHKFCIDCFLAIEAKRAYQGGE